MPIIVQGKVVSSKELEEIKAKRPKYTLNKSNDIDESYEEAKIIIDGKIKKLSKSSNYMLDMLSDEEEGK